GEGTGVSQEADSGVDTTAPAEAAPNPDNGEFNSTASYATGIITEDHNLATYQSLGRTQGLALRYNSLRAVPKPLKSIFDDNYTNLIPAGDGKKYLAAKMQLFLGNDTFTVPGNKGQGGVGADLEDFN